VVVSRLSADGSSKIVLRAPVRHDSGAVGFCIDGTRHSMARLLSLAPDPANPPVDCFAIIDDDVLAHAEWRTLWKDALPVSEGDQLLIEWDEAFSIGMGGTVRPSYARPPVGSYRVHVQTIDLFGQPAGPESSLIIRVLAPWWQRPWAWGMALAATIAGTVGLTRYFAHRRIREQLVHLKEEQIIERERMRIARDIHDTLAQGFTGVIVQLEAAEDAQSRGLAEETSAHVKRAGDLARGSLQEARRSVRSLRQPACEQQGLPNALGALLEKMTAGTAVRAKLITDGESRRLAPEAEENLLHIGQEALVNALRHANASQFTARLVFGGKAFRLELQDDGCGFDQAVAHDGFGLIGMKERAQTMGGELSIQTTRMGGTTISIALPVPRDAQSGEPR
jgi:signal transduction histidine kinase